MLDIGTISAEERLVKDLADSFAESHLKECAQNLSSLDVLGGGG